MGKGKKQAPSGLIFLKGLLLAFAVYLPGQLLITLLVVKGAVGEESLFPCSCGSLPCGGAGRRISLCAAACVGCAPQRNAVCAVICQRIDSDRNSLLGRGNYLDRPRWYFAALRSGRRSIGRSAGTGKQKKEKEKTEGPVIFHKI